MEEGVVFHPGTKMFRVKYLFKDDPRKLSNNRKTITKMAELTEQRLEQDGLAEEANKVFQAMIDAGAMEEVSKKELSSWDGPVHYVPIQHVIKEGSVSTPCRLVTNSLLNDSQGLSLNGILAKEPMIRTAMPTTWMAGKQGKLRDLTPVRHHTYPDLLLVRGRTKEGMKRMYGAEYLPILMASTRTTDHDVGPQEGSRRGRLHLLHPNSGGVNRGRQEPGQEDQGGVHLVPVPPEAARGTEDVEPASGDYGAVSFL